ncbi:restriction endonuclease subunit S [Proteus terrae]|uniref:restriction endonuclease subunit S n=1 Tax=Proteus terrae TaxID=1574161 RepID=UPI00301D429C
MTNLSGVNLNNGSAVGAKREGTDSPSQSLALMPKYEDYVDSGVEWLGDLPSHWDAVKMKFLFKDTSMKNKPNETLLSVTQSQGVVPREWVENRMVMPSGNLESFKFIAKGDFAISLRSFEGGLEYCHHDGIISPAYTVLKTKKDYLLAGYYKYLFKSQTFISELQTSIVGIREGKNISYEELQYSLLPIPAEEEQILIANFLDKKAALIDEAISIKEKQINLLKERKQIIIQQAVTQGLDPNVPMKDSGVDWIGKIPEHWNLKSLKRVVKEHSGNGFPIELQGQAGDIPFLKVSDLSCEGILVDKSSNRVSHKVVQKQKWNIVPAGSLVTAKIGEALRKNHRKLLAYDSIIDNNCIAFECVKIEKKYNFYLHLVIDFDWFVNPGAVPSISVSKYKSQKVVVPSMKEQVLIANFLDKKTALIDEAISIKEKQIEKLKEYKTTLINSAVTGKIKITPEMVEQ